MAETPKTYYQPGENRATNVERLFSKIAPRYDLINDLQSFGLHRSWKRRLVRLAEPKRGERALDVCCGTGDIALALAKCGVETTGVDFSQPMLRIAEQKLQADVIERRIPEPGSAQFICGDAQALPFPENSFDIVTIGYGLRNLADWKAGLQEMWRVAKPGGRILVLDFAKPDNALWRGVYFTYLRCIVPIFGKVFCGDTQAYSYILESLTHYPAQHGVAEQMRKLGCADVRTVVILGGVMSINYARKMRSNA